MPAAQRVQTDSFDTKSFLAAFLADLTVTSIELPKMTAAERKHAKQVIERFPELKCDSYGFGRDRKLHVFKQIPLESPNVPKSAIGFVSERNEVQMQDGERSSVGSKHMAECTRGSAFSVRNTFIDDWVAMEAKEGAGSAMFRSMPPVLQKDSQKSFGGVKNEDCGLVCPITQTCQVGDEPWQQRQTSPDRSTAASSNSPLSTNREESLLVPLPLGLSPPPGLEVRNTFIHFETSPADQRNVQSMPHGMFSRCLREEASTPPTLPPPILAWEQNSPPPPMGTAALPPCVPPPEVPAEAASSPGEECAPSWFATGAEVEIVGLLKMPAFNGQKAIVQGWDDASERYTVLLDLRVASGQRLAKLKSENLVSLRPSPPPPGFAASLSTDSEDEDVLGVPSFPPTPTMWGNRLEQAHPLRLTGLL
eukprot:TRINITY_DN57361_c0_g1_i1.p1 TRINITY_DN57361_c0_g1~~TRINITY_DN57361_c0_g1_i1.p1  ORF type:complete len:421 (-),score=77.37 TRINITY_DN57361_c0_g1_i1:484-1746(-)